MSDSQESDGHGFEPRRFEDLSNLRDQMEAPLAACRRYPHGFHLQDPAVQGLRSMFDPGDFTERYRRLIVVSDLCRGGLTSLLRQEMGDEPSQVLHATIEDALAALARV